MTTTISGSTGVTFPVQAGGTSQTQSSSGKVLQVVSIAKTDTFSSSTNSFVDITGLSVSITPTSATSKIYITANIIVGRGSAAQSGYRIVRDSTAVGVGDAAGSRTQATASSYNGNADVTGQMVSASMSYLDSPATTSATTYKIQVRAQAGGYVSYVNRNSDDSDNAEYYRDISTITVMEIAA